jgi:hypothetical protein
VGKVKNKGGQRRRYKNLVGKVKKRISEEGGAIPNSKESKKK